MNKPTQIQVEKDLFLVDVLSAALILTVVLIPDSPLRLALGLPFVLFFPGYMVISALFPKKMDLGIIERLTLSLGVSLAVVPLIALGLNYTPWGIRITPILTSLFAFTFAVSIFLYYRRTKLPSEQKYSLNLALKIPTFGTRNRVDKFVLVGFLVGLILIVSLTGYLASAPKTGGRFTEFYMLGQNGQLNSYPTYLTLGQNGTVTLGIVNHEYANVTYKIVVVLDNQTIDTLNNIALGNEATWEQNYTFTPQVVGEKISLGFQLYMQGVSEPYRNLDLLITVRLPE
jgi:uncharacterized membrane protein